MKSNMLSNGDKPVHHKKRSFKLWLLVIIFLVLSLSGFFRFQQVLVNWNWVSTQKISPGPLLIAASGILFCLANLLVACCLWFRVRWAAGVTRLVTAANFAGYWIDRTFFYHSMSSFTNAPFMLFITLIYLCVVFWLLERDRKRWNEL